MSQNKNLIEVALSRQSIMDTKLINCAPEKTEKHEVESGSIWYDPILKYNVRVVSIKSNKVYLAESSKFGISINEFIKRYEFVK